MGFDSRPGCSRSSSFSRSIIVRFGSALPLFSPPFVQTRLRCSSWGAVHYLYLFSHAYISGSLPRPISFLYCPPPHCLKTSWPPFPSFSACSSSVDPVSMRFFFRARVTASPVESRWSPLSLVEISFPSYYTLILFSCYGRINTSFSYASVNLVGSKCFCCTICGCSVFFSLWHVANLYLADIAR